MDSSFYFIFDIGLSILKYIYPDDIAMKLVEKTAEKYNGGLFSGIKENYIYASVTLMVPDQDSFII